MVGAPGFREDPQNAPNPGRQSRGGTLAVVGVHGVPGVLITEGGLVGPRVTVQRRGGGGTADRSASIGVTLAGPWGSNPEACHSREAERLPREPMDVPLGSQLRDPQSRDRRNAHAPL